MLAWSPHCEVSASEMLVRRTSPVSGGERAKASRRPLHWLVRRSAPPLPVGVASMSYDPDVHEALGVVDGVHDAVVSDPDSPQIDSSLQLDASVWPWIGRKSLDPRNDPPRGGCLEPFEFPSSRAGEDNPVLRHADVGARARAASPPRAPRAAPRLVL